MKSENYRGTFILDLDGVVHEFAYTYAKWVQDDLRCKFSDDVLKVTDFTNYKFYESWGWDDEQFLETQQRFAEARGFEHGDMLPGTRNLLLRLKAMNLKVIVVTFRPEEANEDTYRWCWTKLGIPKNDVYFAQHKPQVLLDGGEEKFPKPWFAIDDYEKHIRAYTENGIMGFLWAQPWNQHEKNFVRWNNFDKVCDTIQRRLTFNEVSNALPDKAWPPEPMYTPPRADIPLVKYPDYAPPNLPRTGEVTVTNEQTGGKKGIKPERMDLIPVGPLTELSRLYGEGAKKYEDRNWEKGYDWNLGYGAMLRHITQFWNGEDRDSETGCHHLASVAFHAFALMQFGVTHPELDNRPTSVSLRRREPDSTDGA